MKNLKVFIIDESPFFLRWLRKLVPSRPEIRIVGEAKDPLAALEFIRRMKPDVIIMDFKMQWRFGIDLAGNLGRVKPIPRIIMLTSDIWRRRQRKEIGSADFFIDKMREYHLIPEILTVLMRLRLEAEVAQV
jgi:chemotaxis response regulator CheB